MNYEHFGAFLQDLRIRHNLSREKLADNICTSKQIYRIEKGLSEPSLYLITQLSIKFNMDLHEYYTIYFRRDTITGIEGIKSINAVLEKGDIPLLKTMIEELEILDEFKKGDNLQHIYYSKALCYALLDKNYSTSLEYCMKGIRIEYPDFNLNNIAKTMYSNVGLTLLNCISQNYFALKQYSNGMKVLTELHAVLEFYSIYSPYPFIHASQFSKNIYQVVLNNLGGHLLEHGDLKEALYYVEKGIEFSSKEHHLKYLANLIFMKFRILYYGKNFVDAKEYYNRTIYLYKITKADDKIAELEESIRTEYPQILNV
jgi:transcriptional regulator with XRE-family HTH domain